MPVHIAFPFPLVAVVVNFLYQIIFVFGYGNIY